MAFWGEQSFCQAKLVLKTTTTKTLTLFIKGINGMTFIVSFRIVF